eukprot:6563958-Pyramimonas_sp.AAC.1
MPSSQQRRGGERIVSKAGLPSEEGILFCSATKYRLKSFRKYQEACAGGAAARIGSTAVRQCPHSLARAPLLARRKRMPRNSCSSSRRPPEWQAHGRLGSPGEWLYGVPGLALREHGEEGDDAALGLGEVREEGVVCLH